jgi:hypothetical protein
MPQSDWQDWLGRLEPPKTDEERAAIEQSLAAGRRVLEEWARDIGL